MEDHSRRGGTGKSLFAEVIGPVSAVASFSCLQGFVWQAHDKVSKASFSQLTYGPCLVTVPAMKLLRFGSPGNEKPGLQLEDGSRIDASGFGMDWNHDFFADPANLEKLTAWAAANAVNAPRKNWRKNCSTAVLK